METRYIVMELRRGDKEEQYIEINLQMNACSTELEAEEQIRSINKKENFGRTYTIKKVYFK